jgi:hypothetical protein
MNINLKKHQFHILMGLYYEIILKNKIFYKLLGNGRVATYTGFKNASIIQPLIFNRSEYYELWNL